jgi:hypothetical protein
LLGGFFGWLRWQAGYDIYVTSLAMMDIYLSGYALYAAWLVSFYMLPGCLSCPCWLGLLCMPSMLTSNIC